MFRKTNIFRRMLIPVLIITFLGLLLGCGTGGLTDPPAGGGTGTGTGTGSIALSLTKISDGASTTSVSVDSPAKLIATAKDSAGSPIVGKVVSFSTTSDLSFNPASGTALTDSNGKASNS